MYKNDSLRPKKDTISVASVNNAAKYQKQVKEYGLRNKESQYHKDALETSYDRACESALFGIDTEMMALTMKSSLSASTPKHNSSSASNFKRTNQMSVFSTSGYATPVKMKRQQDASASDVLTKHGSLMISRHTSLTGSMYTPHK